MALFEQTPKKSLQIFVNATNNEQDWSGSSGIQALPNSGSPTRIIEQHISDCSTSESDDNEAKENRLELSKNFGVKKSFRRQPSAKILKLDRNNRRLNESTRTVLSPRKVDSQQREHLKRNHSFNEATIICPITPPRQLISQQYRQTQIIIDSTSPVASANKQTDYSAKASELDETTFTYPITPPRQLISGQYRQTQIIIDSTSPVASAKKETDTSAKASELDLLIELIEQQNDEQIASKSKNLKKAKAKRCHKDSYVAQFRRTMLRSRMDRRFLANARLMGSAAGVELLVTSISESFGVYKANVMLVDNAQINTLPSFSVILNANICKQVTVGSRLEAFFDEPPIQLGDETVFAQPLKVFLI